VPIPYNIRDRNSATINRAAQLFERDGLNAAEKSGERITPRLFI